VNALSQIDLFTVRRHRFGRGATLRGRATTTSRYLMRMRRNSSRRRWGTS
jgi:hypothetical protein